MKIILRREFIKRFVYYSLFISGALSVPLLISKKKNALSEPGLDFEALYLKLHKKGELRKRGEQLWQIMKSCKLCPRKCGIDRLSGKEGFCHASSKLEIWQIIMFAKQNSH